MTSHKPPYHDLKSPSLELIVGFNFQQAHEGDCCSLSRAEYSKRILCCKNQGYSESVDELSSEETSQEAVERTSRGVIVLTLDG